MSEHAFQIVLIAVGGLIGFGSSLAAAWLASHHANTRHRKDRLARIHELMGIRCALRDSDPREEEAVWSKWLKTNDARKLDRIAFMAGFFETNNMQLKELIEERSIQQVRVAEAEAKTAKLQQELDDLMVKRDALASKKAALESEKQQLDQSS